MSVDVAPKKKLKKQYKFLKFLIFFDHFSRGGDAQAVGNRGTVLQGRARRGAPWHRSGLLAHGGGCSRGAAALCTILATAAVLWRWLTA